jgi:hypothetical protein
MHDLNADDRNPGATKGFEAEHRPGNAFDGTVILLDEVVQGKRSINRVSIRRVVGLKLRVPVERGGHV